MFHCSTGCLDWLQQRCRGTPIDGAAVLLVSQLALLAETGLVLASAPAHGGALVHHRVVVFQQGRVHVGAVARRGAGPGPIPGHPDPLGPRSVDIADVNFEE